MKIPTLLQFFDHFTQLAQSKLSTKASSQLTPLQTWPQADEDERANSASPHEEVRQTNPNFLPSIAYHSRRQEIQQKSYPPRRRWQSSQHVGCTSTTPPSLHPTNLPPQGPPRRQSHRLLLRRSVILRRFRRNLRRRPQRPRTNTRPTPPSRQSQKRSRHKEKIPKSPQTRRTPLLLLLLRVLRQRRRRPRPLKPKPHGRIPLPSRRPPPLHRPLQRTPHLLLNLHPHLQTKTHISTLPPRARSPASATS